MNDTEVKTEGQTEEQTEQKKPSIFSRCHARIVGEGQDRHIEVDCKTKADSQEYAELLEREVVIRVKPELVVQEE